MLLAELEFPSIDNLVKWPQIADGIPFNKIVLIDVLAVVITVVVLKLATKRQMVPKGMQNLGEATVSFIDEGIVQQTIGHGGENPPAGH